jgi:hypothetical protein
MRSGATRATRMAKTTTVMMPDRCSRFRDDPDRRRWRRTARSPRWPRRGSARSRRARPGRGSRPAPRLPAATSRKVGTAFRGESSGERRDHGQPIGEERARIVEEAFALEDHITRWGGRRCRSTRHRGRRIGRGDDGPMATAQASGRPGSSQRATTATVATVSATAPRARPATGASSAANSGESCRKRHRAAPAPRTAPGPSRDRG